MKLALAATALILVATQANAQEISQRFLSNFFAPLQELSIANKREYCGYFGLNDDDELIASKATKGEEDGCLADEPGPEMVEILASYHTHGAFHYEADAETPSTADLEADIEEEVDGYVATPGGRIWMNDVDKELAIMMCDRNCTVSDPNYDNQAFPPVNGTYDLDGLYDRDDAEY